MSPNLNDYLRVFGNIYINAYKKINNYGITFFLQQIFLIFSILFQGFIHQVNKKHLGNYYLKMWFNYNLIKKIAFLRMQRNNYKL